MARRLPASMRTREELMSLIEGRLSTASPKDELVKVATRLIIEQIGRRSDWAGLLPARSTNRTTLPKRISDRLAKDRRGRHCVFCTTGGPA
jgi:hypothetical protein